MNHRSQGRLLLRIPPLASVRDGSFSWTRPASRPSIPVTDLVVTDVEDGAYSADCKQPSCFEHHHIGGPWTPCPIQPHQRSNSYQAHPSNYRGSLRSNLKTPLLTRSSSCESDDSCPGLTDDDELPATSGRAVVRPADTDTGGAPNDGVRKHEPRQKKRSLEEVMGSEATKVQDDGYLPVRKRRKKNLPGRMESLKQASIVDEKPALNAHVSTVSTPSSLHDLALIMAQSTVHHRCLLSANAAIKALLESQG